MNSTIEKMRQIKLWLITIAMMLCCGTVGAYDFKVDGICYNILSTSELTCEVTYQHQYTHEETSYKGDIVIPATVKNGEKTYRVIKIGSKAFYNDRELTSIVLPEGIMIIDDGAFTRCI